MAKKPNGFTAWIVVGLTVLAMYTTTVVWGIRLESKTELNKTEIGHWAEDIKEIKGDIKLILEKL